MMEGKGPLHAFLISSLQLRPGGKRHSGRRILFGPNMEGVYCRTGIPGLKYMFKDQRFRLKERLNTFSCGCAAICAGI